jgi:hypothetical protein
MIQKQSLKRNSQAAMLEPNDIIKRLKLKPLPGEGGYYRETYRSESKIKTGRQDSRNLATAIYYLITPDNFSTIHRVKSDEMFHFYAGDPAEMLLLYPKGGSKLVILGPDIQKGQQPQILVPRNVWQGTRLKRDGRWALLGTTVSPGFDFADYEHGKKSDLSERFPSRKKLINELCRE